MAFFEVRHYQVGMIQTNCWFMINRDTGQGLIIDPGDEPERLAREMKKENFSPEAILLTHGHFDHVMGVEQLRAQTGAKVYIHETDRQTVEETVSQPMMGFQPSSVPVDVWMTGEPVLELAGFRIQVLLTPGHTRGGVCYYFENEGVLFSGDTLFAGSIGRTDFPGGSYSALIHSVEQKLFPLPDETRVYPGHEGTTTIGFEKEYNPFF